MDEHRRRHLDRCNYTEKLQRLLDLGGRLEVCDNVELGADSLCSRLRVRSVYNIFFCVYSSFCYCFLMLLRFILCCGVLLSQDYNYARRLLSQKQKAINTLIGSTYSLEEHFDMYDHFKDAQSSRTSALTLTEFTQKYSIRISALYLDNKTILSRSGTPSKVSCSLSSLFYS